MVSAATDNNKTRCVAMFDLNGLIKFDRPLWHGIMMKITVSARQVASRLACMSCFVIIDQSDMFGVKSNVDFVSLEWIDNVKI